MWCDDKCCYCFHFLQEARTQGTEDATETRTEAVSGSVIQVTVLQRTAGIVVILYISVCHILMSFAILNCEFYA